MTIPARPIFIGLAATALLAGCGQSDKQAAAGDDADPAVTGALGDQIMVDPDLAGQNGAAVSADGSAVALPPAQRSPEAIAAAQQDATRKVGGTIENAPEPAGGSTASLVESAATAAQVAEASKAASTDCASKVDYSMNWATRLPSALAVYPRGAVQEAAGIDGDGCALTVVNFVTPVGTRDVLGYYYTMARKAGYGADYRMEGDDHVLGGRSGGKAYLLYVRKLDGGPNEGLTEVDMIASGK